MREIKIPKVVLAYGIVIAMVLSGFGPIAATTHQWAGEPDAAIPKQSTLYVNGYEFDCLASEPRIPSELTAAPPRPGVPEQYMAHFNKPVQQYMMDSIEASGANVISYIPNFAYRIMATPEQAECISGLDYVDWVGQYHPAYRLSPGQW